MAMNKIICYTHPYRTNCSGPMSIHTPDFYHKSWFRGPIWACIYNKVFKNNLGSALKGNLFMSSGH